MARLYAYSLKEGVPMYLTQLVVTMFKSHEATNMSRKPEVRPYDWECPTINKDDANIVMSAA